MVTNGFRFLVDSWPRAPTFEDHGHGYPKGEILVLFRCCHCNYVRRVITTSIIYHSGRFRDHYDSCPKCHHVADDMTSKDGGEYGDQRESLGTQCTCCFHYYRRVWRCWACGNDTKVSVVPEEIVPQDEGEFEEIVWQRFNHRFSLNCRMCQYRFGVECVIYWKAMKPRDEFMAEYESDDEFDSDSYVTDTDSGDGKE